MEAKIVTFFRCLGAIPVGNKVNEVLFEHVAPLFDYVEQSTLHATAIHPHPPVEHMHRLQSLHLFIYLLITTGQRQTDGSLAKTSYYVYAQLKTKP